MLLEDDSWSALPPSCLLPCLYHNIWTFDRFKRGTFPFPRILCWCLSFTFNICTSCASCWSTESHHRIPKAICWPQSVCFRPSGILKPNFMHSSSLLKFKIVTLDYECVRFTKIVESLLENYSATFISPDMYLLYTILGELAQFHSLEIIIDYWVWGPLSLLLIGYRDYFLGLKRPERYVYSSPPSSAVLRMSRNVPLLPLYAFMAWTGTFYPTKCFNCFKISDELLDMRWSHLNTW
jgi:hypothetical protein